MSRCFPYPPPGYTLSSARNEALIESIKLQKEKERKKEKKRGKKEKKKERKEKKDKTNYNLDKSDTVKGHIGQKICSDPKGEFLQKRRETENKQFEQSTLTEEHGHPDSLPVPSSSFDSTENNNKRKRHSSPTDGSHGHANGQKLCSISGRTDLPASHKAETDLSARPENFCCTSEGINNIGQDFTLRNNREEICSTSGQIEALALGKSGISSTPNEVANCTQGIDLHYKNLLENWVPPRLHDAGLYPVDSDWLFQDTRKPEIRAEKRQRSGSDGTSCSRSLVFWPRAEYLNEIDAYALPFVVPY